MSIRRRWIATCDGPGCNETWILNGDQWDGRVVTGESISDLGWDAMPSRTETYCPKHAAPAVHGATPAADTDEAGER